MAVVRLTRHQLALAAIVIVGLALRLLLVGEMTWADLDLTFEPHRDMHAFWENARRIAAGDVLLRHGYHAWDDIMESLLGHDLVKRLYTESTYYNAPLYMYLLALGQRLLGPDPYRMLAVQALVSAATVLIVYRLGREAFDPTIGLVAAGLVAAQDTLIFYSGFLVRETLFTFFMTGAMLLAVMAVSRGWRWSALAGGVLGLAWLTRGETAVFALPLIALGLAWGQPRRAAVVRVAALVGALVLVSSPFLIRNVALGVPALRMSCSDLHGLINSNLPTATPRMITFNPPLSRRVAELSGGSLLRAAWITTRLHGSPGRLLAFMGRKLLASWNGYEPWNNSDLNYYRRVLLAFRVPLVSAGLLLPLSLVGMVLDRRAFCRHAALYGGALAPFVFMVLTYVVDRYRLPAYPGLAVFAALALVSVARDLSARRGRAAVLAIAMAALVWVSRDQISATEKEDAAQAFPAIYLSLGRPWAVRYLVLHVRDPTPTESYVRSTLPR